MQFKLRQVYFHWKELMLDTDVTFTEPKPERDGHGH
jgi:hypothetical protein